MRVRSRLGAAGSLAVPVALVLILAADGAAVAQESEPALLRDAEQVAEVRIESETLLGALDDPFDLSALFVQIDRTSDGSWMVLSRTHERHEIAEYGPDGDFLGTVGGAGEGPGEFRLLRAFVILPEDSLFVVDFAGEFSVLSRTGEWVRGGRLGFDPLEIVGLGDGRVVAAANSAIPQLAGLPLHLVDPGNDPDFRVRSLGNVDGVLDPEASDLERQRIPVVRAWRPDRILSIDRVKYLIEEWSLQG